MEPSVAEELQNMGVSLIDPAPQLASMIVDLKHFKKILNSTPLPKRKTAYEALRPHLSFEVPEYSMIRLSVRQKRS